MADEWDGTERRTEERATIYEQLGELRVRVAHIEKSISKLDKVSDQLDTFSKQSQGVVNLFRVLIYIGGPITALVYWLKDNLR